MAVQQETAKVRAESRTRAFAAPWWVVGVLTGGLTFWLAYENGSYAEPNRQAITIAVWWGVIVALACGFAANSRTIASSAVVAAGLAGFALWMLASMAWASDSATAFDEFDRASLYVGVFVLCSLLFRRRDLAAWCDGIGFGIVAVGVLALVSRFFPSAIGRASGGSILPALVTRLSYPVGYWNGLGILCALGAPLMLAAATGERPRWVRAAAAGSIPLLGTAIYLTSSRGAVATGIVAIVLFVVLTPLRWAALATLAVSGAATAISVVLVDRRHNVVNGVSGSTALAVVVFGIAVVTAAIYAGLLSTVRPRTRPPSAVGWGLAAAAMIVVLAAVLLSHPVRRFDAFKAPPTALAVSHGDYVKAHLLSGSGSGRWQFWHAAVDQFDTSRVHGRGAGSYASWWAAHGSLATSIQDAHSLYLETLGELGLVGLILLLLPLFVAAAAITNGIRRLRTGEQVVVSGAVALVGGYLVAAGIDWMWELTAVSVVAFAVLAIAVAACAVEAPAVRRGRYTRLGAATLIAAWLAACAAALPLLTQLEIGASQAAARQGRTVTALKSANSAVRLQPWSAQPYLQLALVSEQSGQLPIAETAIRRAIARAPDNWQLWLVATRIETKRGRIPAARRSLARAEALNPRSPLFAGDVSASSGKERP